MTVRASQSETHIVRHANDNVAFEQDHPPVSLLLAVMVVAMNVVSAVMSLMA
jgi:hypothetical protein